MDHDSLFVKRPFPLLLVTLSVAGFALIAIIVAFWLVAHPESDTLSYEAIKTSMQVLGVVVIGGIVSIATSKWQQERERAAEHMEHQRKENAEELERQRSAFNLRTTLLDRTSRCAQGMYVTCQHVSRVHRDEQSTLRTSPKMPASALALLNESYLEFSAEAAALRTEIGARYSFNKADHTVGIPGEAYLRWHQIGDLLTVYYFNLCGNFRTEILEKNSRSETDIHSGLNLAAMVKDPKKPTKVELRNMRREIRKEFVKTMPLLADALLKDELRSR